MTRLLPGLIAIVLASASPASNAADVTIYRCVDSKGKLTLRDTPCAKGETQETRSMVRPKDAPSKPAAAPPVVIEPSIQRPRVVVAYAPRPLYECTRPDGSTYTSDNDDGNPRYEPLWTQGYPLYPVPLNQTSIDFRFSNRHVDISGGTRPVVRPVPLPGPSYPSAFYGSTLVRDNCYALPASEACARMSDRRDEIRRRFFNAQPSERDVLRVEERGLNARLDSECN